MGSLPNAATPSSSPAPEVSLVRRQRQGEHRRLVGSLRLDVDGGLCGLLGPDDVARPLLRLRCSEGSREPLWGGLCQQGRLDRFEGRLHASRFAQPRLLLTKMNHSVGELSHRTRVGVKPIGSLRNTRSPFEARPRRLEVPLSGPLAKGPLVLSPRGLRAHGRTPDLPRGPADRPHRFRSRSPGGSRADSKWRGRESARRGK